MPIRIVPTHPGRLVRLWNASLILIVLLCNNLKVFSQSKSEPYSYRELDSMHAVAQEQKNISGFQPRNFHAHPFRNPPVSPATTIRSSVVTQMQQVSCMDTSERFFLKNDSIVFYTYDPTLSADGHVLLSGEYIKWVASEGYQDAKGFVMKTDQKGNIIWLHTYDTLANHSPHHFLSYYKIKELKNGSILLVGLTSKHDETLNDPVIITKIDPSGNMIWSKTYKSRFWTNGDGSADYYVAHEIQEDPQTADIYISGKFWGAGKGITKLDANGNLLWSRTYHIWSNGYATFDSPFGLDIREKELRFFGRYHLYGPAITIYRINKINGDTLQTKYFRINDPEGTKVGFVDHEPLTILENGNYAVSGGCYGQFIYLPDGTKPFYQAAVAEFDSNLNFVRAYAFVNYIQSNMYNTRVTVFPDGSSIFSMLHYLSGYTTDVFYIQTRNAQIAKQRKVEYRGQGAPNEPPALRLPDGSDMITRMIGDSATNTSRIEYLKLHISDTSSTCLGADDTSTYIYPFKYEPYDFVFDSIPRDVFREARNKSLVQEDRIMQKFQSCSPLSYCDTLSLISPVTTICLTQPLEITIQKNDACGARPSLMFDTSVIRSFKYLNDSTASFRFSKPWSGNIYSSLDGCTVMYDSIFINVLQTPDTLNLGPDKGLCPGNRIVLNARKGYDSYVWQDGSTDSTYTVTSPGWYFVKTKDACGGVYVDSMLVVAAPPIEFYAGPDRSKCNRDTLHLNAPPGFLNYTWKNSYNINTTSGQTVVVSPMVDTTYYVQAEKTPGCFAYDTIRITVHQSPDINLGMDTSICSGDSLILNAGAGFQSWQWSNQLSTNEIIVKTAGQYSVIATTINGCKSFDTVKVLNVYSLPVVQLDQDTVLCIGSGKVLDAGIFSTYKWSTGAETRTITVRDKGTYTVNVTSASGCKGSASTSIKTIYELPSAFLPNDTAMCTYSKMEIKSTRTFNRYVWNTGIAGSSITVSKPGLYWMEASDANNCTGRDSILVSSKDCLQGFYIPNAFTPNDDFRNDVFRPLLFGRVENYSFSIFNRWGQLIFHTTELQKGWDGKIGGLIQQTGVYGWICTYKVEGEQQQTQKGTVTLIK